MATINYETDKYRRRLIFEDERLIEAEYYPRQGIEPGMVFLGRVEDYHATIRGFFIDLGERQKGIYQGKERLVVGRHYLFEVRKVQPKKHPVLSRNIGMVGKYVIYRPEKDTAVSDGIPEPMRSILLNKGFRHVYYKREAAQVSFYKVEEEIRDLEYRYRKAVQSEAGERFAKLIYRPGGPEVNWDEMEIIEFEEELVRLRQGTIIDDDITYHVDMTRVGLIIDVNSGRSSLNPNQVNDKAMEFISRLLITMNVGGLVIMDLIGKGKQEHFHDLMKLDSRITHVNISKLGLLEISRKRVGTNVYDIPLLEVMADYVKYRLGIELERGRKVRGIELSRRYRGIEDYLEDLEVSYNEVFGYFQFY